MLQLANSRSPETISYSLCLPPYLPPPPPSPQSHLPEFWAPDPNDVEPNTFLLAFSALGLPPRPPNIPPVASLEVSDVPKTDTD